MRWNIWKCAASSSARHLRMLKIWYEQGHHFSYDTGLLILIFRYCVKNFISLMMKTLTFCPLIPLHTAIIYLKIWFRYAAYEKNITDSDAITAQVRFIGHITLFSFENMSIIYIDIALHAKPGSKLPMMAYWVSITMIEAKNRRAAPI